MKSVIIAIAAGVGGAALGFWAGWTMRKKTEVVFEEVTEEEQRAYAAQFEKKEEPEEPAAEEVPKVETDGTVVNPALDTHATDYTEQWRAQEQRKAELISKRESYGSPTPGDEENLEPGEDDLEEGIDRDFIEETKDEILPIGEMEFEDPNDDAGREIYIWYDRDDVFTRMEDEDVETVIDNPEREMGFDPRKEYAEATDITKENVGLGLFLFRENQHTNTKIKIVRYPFFYSKRKQQEEYGGSAEEYREWMHQRQ